MPWILKCSVSARPCDYGDGLTTVILARMINTKKNYFIIFHAIQEYSFALLL